MNFLAHLYLSGDDEDLMIGNFIADSIRKVQWEQYRPSIIRGVELHHFIDDFTDSHKIVKQSKSRLYEGFGKYSPVIVDIFYDHFLALNWNHYHSVPLKKYAHDFYRLIQKELHILPKRIKFIMPYMTEGDWLYNYQFIKGIERVLGGMSRRSPYENNMHKATDALVSHYDLFGKEFELFFPELEKSCKDWLEIHQRQG